MFFFFFPQTESTFSMNSSQLILIKDAVYLLLLGFFPVTWTVLIPGIIKFAAFSYKCLPRHWEDEYLHYLHEISNSQHFWVYLCYTMNLCFLPTSLQQRIEVAGFTLPQPSRLDSSWSIIHTAVDFDINYIFFFTLCTILLHISFLCSYSVSVYNFIFAIPN